MSVPCVVPSLLPLPPLPPLPSRRYSRRRYGSIGTALAASVTVACAVVQEPPGGPPDFAAPVLVAVTPDSGAIVPNLDKPLVFRFDEVIAEANLARLFEVSPRAPGLDVNWKRTAVEIKPEGGWRPGAVYHVRLLAGISDLRSNRLDSARTIIFSTGSEIPDTRITGTVIDWEQGRAGRNAVVEAVLQPDSLVYFTVADSVGDFSLAALPRGRYRLYAVIDGNNNKLRDLREPFDSVTVMLDSTASHVFWTITQDTIGPQIRTVSRVDSVTVRVDFGRSLAPGDPDSTAVTVWALPDTVAVGVRAVWWPAVYDSIRAAETAAGDTTRVGEAGVAPAAGDSLRAGPAPAAADSLRGAAPTDTMQARQRPDTSRAARLLAERPTLGASWVIRLTEPLQPGGRYLVQARAVSVARWPAESHSVLVLPAPTEPQ